MKSEMAGVRVTLKPETTARSCPAQSLIQVLLLQARPPGWSTSWRMAAVVDGVLLLRGLVKKNGGERGVFGGEEGKKERPDSGARSLCCFSHLGRRPQACPE
jgi:hypothetical protein